ncbi:hypothetical protein [Erythrobacter sp. WG]|uniref:hypothetical protein n=1 Tax=Erythrobacter sp. WG TaxID=2985510 RepID=UPI00226F436D|nr:hypothetical protein [Erythrobacter sp. WG]MCX9146601.1 hypothetical protein [Erythrobacter sp. WG]
MWIGLKLLASGALEKLLSGLSGLAKWLVSDWRNAPLVICALMWAVHALLIVPARDRKITETEQLLTATQSAFVDTIISYLAASAQAKRDAEANAARVAAEQEAVTHEVTRDLRSDLAAVSARFDRLRARDAAVDPRRAGPADLPGAGDAAGRAAGAPGTEDLRSAGTLSACPPGLVCLTFDQAQRASEDAHRHDRLIDWVVAQSLVSFTPEGPRR